MGRKSSSSSKAANKVVYGTTTTSNPYVTSKTDNKGSVANFNNGTTYESIFNFVNKNVNNLLDEYLNPTLNSVTNQAKINSFVNNLQNETSKNLENNVINPLSNRNMLRSSQAMDLYKSLVNSNSSQVGSYLNDLLSSSQNDTSNVLNNLLQWYTNGYNILSDAQAQSLATSQGNSLRTTTQNNYSNALDYSQLLNEAIKMATMKAV